MKLSFFSVALAALLLGCDKALPIVENGRSDWKIVHGSAERDKLAATDFQEIFEKATGIQLKLEEGQGQRSRSTVESNLFLVGAEFLGADASKLADEQTCVIAKDGNIILAGGGVAGTCYAVYDFCEKYFGYRMYGTYAGAEKVNRVTDLVWDGKPLSTRPAFTGMRLSWNYPFPDGWNEHQRRFYRRNRCNSWDKPLTKRVMGAQHGHLLFVPAYDNITWLDKEIGTKWPGLFKEHPEYFTMDRHGKRWDRGQLCFSNPELRKIYTKRFREYASKKGPGIYMVGPNDYHNERYCWCPECAKLMAKYKTNGGPIFDYLLELCANIRDMPETYVVSCAYKLPEQTELAPTGVTFPDNFYISLGFLNSDRPLSCVPDIKLEDGSNYNRLESLRKWCTITKHQDYWYYGGVSVVQTYRRMQKEILELYEAGLDSAGSCGTGGGFELHAISDYIYHQLLINPKMDADAAVMDIMRHMFGPAAEIVFEYVREAEQYGIRQWTTKDRFLIGPDDYNDKIPVEGSDVARWQGYFEKALALVKDDPVRTENVRIARVGVDCWNLVWASRVRKDAPSFKFDPSELLKRGFAACEAMERRGMVRKERNYARQAFSSMKYYAEMKTDALPEIFAGIDPQDVKLYLPEDPPHFFAERAALKKDPQALAGVAMWARKVAKAKDGKPVAKLSVVLEDSETHEVLFHGYPFDVKALSDGKYHLVELGISRVPRSGMLVLADAWGSSTDIRTLGRFYDPSYHQKLFQFWASVRMDGDDLLCDRVYLVDKGMP